MGTHLLPSFESYWSTDELLGAPNVVGIDLLKFLGSYILMTTPLLYLVEKPVLNRVREKCMSLYKPHRECSVDEAMVKYKGHSTVKQYMPKKPTERGFKVWCLCDSHNGYTCTFDVYLDATAGSVEKDLGIRATLDMTKDVFGKGFHNYCDNFLLVPS